MKHLIPLLILFTVSAWAEPKAPFIDHRIVVLKARIEKDIKAGIVTETEGRSLQREIAAIEKDEERVRRTGTITPRTRQNLRNDLEKLEASIERKEKSAQPSPSPRK